MPRHTPEPWSRWESDPDEKYPDNIEIGEANGFRIATIWNTMRGDAEANFNLFMAAPKMLLALKYAKAFGSHGTIEGGEHDGMSVSYFIESAIAGCAMRFPQTEVEGPHCGGCDVCPAPVEAKR